MKGQWESVPVARCRLFRKKSDRVTENDGIPLNEQTESQEISFYVCFVCHAYASMWENASQLQLR